MGFFSVNFFVQRTFTISQWIIKDLSVEIHSCVFVNILTRFPSLPPMLWITSRSNFNRFFKKESTSFPTPIHQFNRVKTNFDSQKKKKNSSCRVIVLLDSEAAFRLFYIASHYRINSELVVIICRSYMHVQYRCMIRPYIRKHEWINFFFQIYIRNARWSRYSVIALW